MNIKNHVNSFVELVKNEKTPLVLSVIAQAYSIGLWQWYSSNEISVYWVLNLLVAVITAWSLDAIIVSTVFHKKTHWLHWVFAAATSITVLIFSISIAVTMFNDWKHSVFAVIVFLYSWFLAVVKADIVTSPAFDTDTLIVKLIQGGLTNSAIYDIIGGNRNKTWKRINDIRDDLNQNTNI